MSYLENHLWYANFLKGLLILGQPCTITTWNVTKGFTFIKSKLTLTDCDLETVSHKFAMLLCLTKRSKRPNYQVFDFRLHKDF